MSKLAGINAIARRELGGPRPKLGDVQPCFRCGQSLRLVESYDLEHFLQVGQMVKSGSTWIHAGPDEAAACRRKARS